MKTLIWIFWTAVTVALAVFAVTNRGAVSLSLDPLPFIIESPLNLVILATLAGGFFLGLVTAWTGGRQRRRTARQLRGKLAEQEKELAVFRGAAADARIVGGGYQIPPPDKAGGDDLPGPPDVIARS